MKSLIPSMQTLGTLMTSVGLLMALLVTGFIVNEPIHVQSFIIEKVLPPVAFVLVAVGLTLSISGATKSGRS